MNTSSPDQKSGVGKRVKKKIDKVLLGAVLGGAVGSILGVTFAPKSGKETRKIIGKKGREITNDLMTKISDRRHKNPSEKKGVWHMLNRVFFQKKK